MRMIMIELSSLFFMAEGVQTNISLFYLKVVLLDFYHILYKLNLFIIIIIQFLFFIIYLLFVKNLDNS